MIIPLVFPDGGAIEWQRLAARVFTEWLDVLGQPVCCTGGPLLEKDYFQAVPIWQWLTLLLGLPVTYSGLALGCA
jgi:hypothetical protein